MCFNIGLTHSHSIKRCGYLLYQIFSILHENCINRAKLLLRVKTKYGCHCAVFHNAYFCPVGVCDDIGYQISGRSAKKRRKRLENHSRSSLNYNTRHICMKLVLNRQLLIKYFSTEIHEDPTGGLVADTMLQTD